MNEPKHVATTQTGRACVIVAVVLRPPPEHQDVASCCCADWRVNLDLKGPLATGGLCLCRRVSLWDPAVPLNLGEAGPCAWTGVLPQGPKAHAAASYRAHLHEKLQ